MNKNIHETAIIAAGAKIADDVKIGPYCIIGPQVSIDSGTVLESHVVVERETIIGKKTESNVVILVSPAIEIAPKTNPKNKEPLSPIKIEAGLKL